LLRTVKNKITAAAAAPIATIGSNKLDKKGSGGISPFVKGYEAFSTILMSSYFKVSLYE
jgi:hypothetical protein